MKPIPFVDFQTDVLGVDRGPFKRTLQQRVLFKVGIDHVHPVDLPPEEREIAAVLFGPDVDRLPDAALGRFVALKGARVGGTLACSEVLLWSALTCDLSGLARGERAYAVCIAPTMKLARQSLTMVRGAASGAEAIEELVRDDGADGFVIERPDGRIVSIEVIAASGRGAATRGRTYCAALLDECSFFLSADDAAVVNDLEIYRSVSPRVLPGGRMMTISTAWLASGLLHDMVELNHNGPRTCIAAIAPTPFMRPNDPTLARHIAEQRELDPLNAAREYDCIPLEGSASSFIDAAALEACVDDSLPTEMFQP